MKSGALLRLSGLSLLWGSVFLWIKISGYGFSPVEMVFVRLVLGAAVLMAIGLSRGQRPPRDRTLLGHMAVAALLGNAIPWLLFAQGEVSGSSNVAGIISGTGPVWTLGAAVLLGSEKRLGAARILGMAVGLLGVVLVAAPWSPTPTPPPAASSASSSAPSASAAASPTSAASSPAAASPSSCWRAGS